MTDEQFQTLLKEVRSLHATVAEVNQRLVALEMDNRREHKFFQHQLSLIFQRLEPEIEMLTTAELIERLGFDPGETAGHVTLKRT